jgi:hypothetical protein
LKLHQLCDLGLSIIMVSHAVHGHRNIDLANQMSHGSFAYKKTPRGNCPFMEDWELAYSSITKTNGKDIPLRCKNGLL